MPQSRPEPGSLRDDAGPDTLHRLPTEQVRPGLQDLDLRPTADVVTTLLDAEANVPAALHAVRAELTAAVTHICRQFEQGGRLVYVGAGTPGRIAVLDAVECAPTFGVEPDRVRAVVAGNDTDDADESAEDDTDSARERLGAVGVSNLDVVVGVTASGRTPFVVSALAAARAAGATTMVVTNNPGQAAHLSVDHAVELATGPEVLAGSTRLTAGTAQKVALNVLSTAAMIRWGRTYGAWMVGVQATNGKLQRRALRIIQEITGVDTATAEQCLHSAGQHTQTALVMLLLDVDAATARARLDAADGRVRIAVRKE